MPKHTPERVAEIRSHLAELDRTRAPVADFAHQLGVAAWTVYSWKRKFGQEADATPRSPAVSTSGRADLLEIRGVAPSATIEIQLGDVVVRVPDGSSPQSLRTVLQAVKSC